MGSDIYINGTQYPGRTGDNKWGTFYNQTKITLIQNFGLSPETVGSLQSWWRADADNYSNGAPVGSMSDYVGGSWVAQTGASRLWGTYLANAVNNKPAIRFNAASGSFVAYSRENFSSMTEGEIFIVVKTFYDPTPGGSGTNQLWLTGAATLNTEFPWTNGIIYDGAMSTQRKDTVDPIRSLAQWNIYGVRSKSGSWTNRLNGTDLFNTTTNTFASGSNWILGQAYANNGFNGTIAEMIVYSRYLTNTERQGIEYYLYDKYNLSVSTDGTVADIVDGSYIGSITFNLENNVIPDRSWFSGTDPFSIESTIVKAGTSALKCLFNSSSQNPCYFQYDFLGYLGSWKEWYYATLSFWVYGTAGWKTPFRVEVSGGAALFDGTYTIQNTNTWEQAYFRQTGSVGSMYGTLLRVWKQYIGTNAVAGAGSLIYYDQLRLTLTPVSPQYLLNTGSWGSIATYVGPQLITDGSFDNWLGQQLGNYWYPSVNIPSDFGNYGKGTVTYRSSNKAFRIDFLGTTGTVGFSNAILNGSLVGESEFHANSYALGTTGGTYHFQLIDRNGSAVYDKAYVLQSTGTWENLNWNGFVDKGISIGSFRILFKSDEINGVMNVDDVSVIGTSYVAFTELTMDNNWGGRVAENTGRARGWSTIGTVPKDGTLTITFPTNFFTGHRPLVDVRLLKRQVYVDINDTPVAGIFFADSWNVTKKRIFDGDIQGNYLELPPFPLISEISSTGCKVTAHWRDKTKQDAVVCVHAFGV